MRKGGHVEILVIDVLGRRIRTLASEFVQAGEHDVVWNGRDDSGERVAPGVYLYRFSTDDAVETRKLVLLK
jgi:flagellar hook assembly protein FlgD